jgi:hypothetical protein
MVSLANAERVARTVSGDVPYAYCFPCLANRLGLTEKEVRDAAQLLLARRDFMVNQRTCHRCQQTGEALGLEKDS